MKHKRHLGRLVDSWPKPPKPDRIIDVKAPIAFKDIKEGDLLYVRHSSTITSNFFARVTEKRDGYFIANFQVEWTAINTKQKFIPAGGFHDSKGVEHYVYVDRRYKHPNE